MFTWPVFLSIVAVVVKFSSFLLVAMAVKSVVSLKPGVAKFAVELKLVKSIEVDVLAKGDEESGRLSIWVGVDSEGSRIELTCGGESLNTAVPMFGVGVWVCRLPGCMCFIGVCCGFI